ncbi:hypothetical protein N9J52_03720 [Flavobacteriales bacterium]|nr:hypothetical protein [Flavobacteriales bacterium]
MKHLFTFLLVAISATSFAQGNLQFNQVINVSGIKPAGNNAFTTVTVPAGKVWKITSSTFLINGEYTADYVCIGSNLLYGHFGPYALQTFPIWLQEGDYDVENCNVTTYYSTVYAISGIEFNIVP